MGATRKRDIKATGHIRFFKTNRFGFYQRKDKATTQVGGGMAELLESFCDWTVDRDFAKTIPWDPEKFPHRQEIYCKDVSHRTKTGDFLVVFWKRFGVESGKVTGIKESAKVGDDTTDSVKVDAEFDGEPAILGQPMYYWFIPEHNLVATVNFAHSSSITKPVCDYLRRCLQTRVDHPAKVTTTETINDGEPFTRIQFEAPGGGYMTPIIDINLKQLKSDVANAKVLAKKITHLVIRDTISSDVINTSSGNDSLFQLLFELKSALHQAKGKKKKQKVYKKIEIIEERTLSVNEVRKIIEAHRSDRVVDDGWEDIGFKVEGKKGINWFSQYVGREEIEMRRLPETANYYKAGSLLNALTKNRDELLLQIVDEAAQQSSSQAT